MRNQLVPLEKREGNNGGILRRTTTPSGGKEKRGGGDTRERVSPDGESEGKREGR